jgi:hypothetical protein
MCRPALSAQNRLSLSVETTDHERGKEKLQYEILKVTECSIAKRGVIAPQLVIGNSPEKLNSDILVTCS